MEQDRRKIDSAERGYFPIAGFEALFAPLHKCHFTRIGSLYFRQIPLGLQPGLAIGGAFFRQQHIHNLVSIIAGIYG